MRDNILNNFSENNLITFSCAKYKIIVSLVYLNIKYKRNSHAYINMNLLKIRCVYKCKTISMFLLSFFITIKYRYLLLISSSSPLFMKKSVIIIIFALLIQSSLIMSYAEPTESDPLVVDLIAGQHDVVGTVAIWNEGTNLYVKYQTLPGYYLTEVHTEVEASYENMPLTNKGSPKIGLFDYIEEDLHTTEKLVQLVLNETWVKVDVAAHAVVKADGEISDICTNLPDEVQFTIITYPYDKSYVQINVWEGLNLDGDHDAWCLNLEPEISIGIDYYATPYCTYGEIPVGVVDEPGNLDLINWILNQDFVGIESSSWGPYTSGDVQNAIWHYIDTTPVTLSDRAQEIVNLASTHEGYEPVCGEYLGIILHPAGHQPLLIKILIPCGYDETAWGQGLDFSSADWSMYIPYTIQGESEIQQLTEEESELPSDEWLIQNAIDSFKDEYPKKYKDINFTGEVTSEWLQNENGYYKIIRLEGPFGYKLTGNVTWIGHSYAVGGIYTLYFSNHDPIPEPTPVKTQVVYIDGAQLAYWDGSKWIYNQPTVYSNQGNKEPLYVEIEYNQNIRVYKVKPDFTLMIYFPM